MRQTPYLKAIGKTFGRLLVTSIKRKQSAGQTRTFAVCQCICGTQKEVPLDILKRGLTRSCGCLSREITTTHGQTNHPMYKTWEGMMSRCYNPNNYRYHDYGGRGIVVCERWHNCTVFIQDGLRLGWEKGLMIDRINNDGNYEPCNIRFTTAKVQANNRRSNHILVFNGMKKNISQWAQELGISRKSIYWRLKKGWSIEQILVGEWREALNAKG